VGSPVQKIFVKKGIYSYSLYLTNDSNGTLEISLLGVDTGNNYGTLAITNIPWGSARDYAGVVVIPISGYVRINFSNNYYQYTSRVALRLVSQGESPYLINSRPLIPRGMIIAWDKTTIPYGWAMCDGRTVNGFKTPDLRGRFVLGYSATFGLVTNGPEFNPEEREYFVNVFNIGDVSGESVVRLSVKDLPSHRHGKIPYRNQLNGGIGEANNNFNNSSDILGYFENTIPEFRQTLPHNNMPPYYVLMYICKV
jgi:microcystin-dependent protein